VPEALRRDPAIRVADAARLLALYTRGVDPAHQRLTLDVTGGGRCELQVWPDQVHVFQALPRLAPEAARAMAHAARFITTSLQASGFDTVAGRAV
jgi:hypothetical protein